MARLTEQEKKNLSSNMNRLNKQRKYTQAYVSKMTGIPLRTYETYLSGSYGASQRNLEKLAHFYQTTPYILVSDNMGETEMALGHELRKYQDSIDERVKSLDELIEDYIVSRDEPCLKTFLELIRSQGITTAYEYDITDDELKKEAQKYLGIDITTTNVISRQFEYKFAAVEGIQLSDEIREQLQALKSLYTKKAEGSDEDEKSNNSFIDTRTGKEVFLRKMYAGVYDDTDILDLPITIKLTTHKEVGNLKLLERLEDLQISDNDISIEEMLEIKDDIIEMIFDSIFTDS